VRENKGCESIIRKSALVLTLVTLFASTACAQESEQPVDTITIAELRDHIFFLASDYLEGRYTGSKGYEIAAEYCASQFAGAGLIPACTDTEGDPTFLQTVPIVTRSVREDAGMTLQVETADAEVESWNVVGIVKGSDPVLKNQYVTVTAHLDHLEPRNGQVMNGADDNASGCAGVMEIAEALVLSPPRRSVIFALFTKEEGGGICSRHFVSNPPVPIEDIVVNLNLDMIGRTHPSVAKQRTHWALNSDTETLELTEIIRSVNERTVNWSIEFEMEQGGVRQRRFDVPDERDPGGVLLLGPASRLPYPE
jgi:hypothetical protein